ncbi:MAG: aminotransferase class I/II-fold pyridoxal phosphate-dependent enzyme [Saprospiraceae bacterium]|nr:aminotransferase class I/II-fold pyridoxal phosphate-dependent enzyme [Saprospiraceae bacterium]
MNIISKLPNVKESVFARMTALANRHQATNLAQGFPDFNPPKELIENLYNAASSNFNQYAPMPGVLSLRNSICERLLDRYHFKANPDSDIVITAGATQALFTVISAFISKNDKVLIIEPAYDSYVPAVISNGGEPVFISLKSPDFKFPLQELKDSIERHSIKMILINNPHNPCGCVLSKIEMESLRTILAEFQGIIVWDEVYDYLVYDDLQHQSALLFEDLMTKSVVIYSMGKTLHNTGWKVGYTVSSPEIAKEIKKLHQFTVFSVNTPAQQAIAEFMSAHPRFFNDLPKFYQDKRDFFLKCMEGLALHFHIPQGSYFALADFKSWFQGDDEEAAIKLVTECGVAAIPLSPFYHDCYDPGMLRFCFAKKEETILQAAEKLQGKLISKL